jgi:hypothetical protein
MDIPADMREDPLSILFDSVARNGGEQMKTLLRLFASDLLHQFGNDQVASILKGYVNSGKLETMEAQEVILEARALNELWKKKAWTAEIAEGFQISILTQPEWEGVSHAFLDHPAYRHLVGIAATQDYDQAPQLVTKQQAKNMREQWEQSSDITLHKDSNSQWTEVRDSEGRVTLHKDVISISGDRIKTWDRSSSSSGGVTNDNNAKPRIVFTEEVDDLLDDPYDVYEDLVEDCEEIEMLVAHSRRGITYVYGTRLVAEQSENLGTKFDLLRCFRVDTDCIIRLELGSRQEDSNFETDLFGVMREKNVGSFGSGSSNSLGDRSTPGAGSSGSSSSAPRWCKDIDVYKNIWYNFSEGLIPVNSSKLNIRMTFIGCEERRINAKIMGVYLTEAERDQQDSDLVRRGFNPYGFGFRRFFKLKV